MTGKGIVLTVGVVFLAILMIFSPLAAGCSILAGSLITLMSKHGYSLETNSNPALTIGIGGPVLIGFFADPLVFLLGLMGVGILSVAWLSDI